MKPAHPFGEVVQDAHRVGLRFVRELRHPPERVWQALTASQDLRHWMPCDIVGPREAGAVVEVPFWPEVVEKYGLDDAALAGEILVWEPPTRFAWRWDTDTLHFDLEATAEGTRLTFTTWIGGGPGLPRIAAGYHVCFDLLVARVGGADLRVADQDPSAYEDAYGERFVGPGG